MVSLESKNSLATVRESGADIESHHFSGQIVAPILKRLNRLVEVMHGSVMLGDFHFQSFLCALGIEELGDCFLFLFVYQLEVN